MVHLRRRRETGSTRAWATGTHQKKGSTLEARFPLSLVKGLIEEDVVLLREAQVGYNTGEPDWKWRQTDLTDAKQLQF